MWYKWEIWLWSKLIKGKWAAKLKWATKRKLATKRKWATKRISD